jgi:hypothetical protein
MGMTVQSKTEYTCDQCGKTAVAEYEGYMPPNWRSLGLSRGVYVAAIVGTWLYVPLTYHFCSVRCMSDWSLDHQPKDLSEIESDGDVSP